MNKNRINLSKKIKFINDDQISDINYSEKYIRDTNVLFIKLLPRIKKLKEIKRINLAIDLLLISQGYRVFKFYNSKKIDAKFKLHPTPKKIHLAIQSRIKDEFKV